MKLKYVYPQEIAIPLVDKSQHMGTVATFFNTDDKLENKMLSEKNKIQKDIYSTPFL